MSYQVKRLLPRHREIFRLFFEEHVTTQKEVARRLMLSERCVSYVVRSPVFQQAIRDWQEENDAERVRKWKEEFEKNQAKKGLK